jgi:signal transduction histidine kinase
MEHSQKLSGDVASRLRTLSHDLSNSLETILQATYLLREVQLDARHTEWVRMIDSASQDAARVNHEIREILRSQS